MASIPIHFNRDVVTDGGLLGSGQYVTEVGVGPGNQAVTHTAAQDTNVHGWTTPPETGLTPAKTDSNRNSI